MSSTTATAHSSALSSPPKIFYNHGSKKMPNAKNGTIHQPCHKRQNDDYPKHNELLHRLSLPSSSSSGTLLERIGGSAKDEAASAKTDSDWIDAERVSEGVDHTICSDLPRFRTPEPGEVERFLESVIGAPPAAPALPSPVHTCSGNKPALALETRNLPVDRSVKVEDPSSSVLYSPTQTAVNSLPSADFTLDQVRQQSPLLGDAMVAPSASAIEECRKHLIPVLLATAQAKGTGKRLDPEQCLRLLSDDQCKNFFRQAKEMRRQLSYPVSQKTPVNQGWGESVKRDRVDEVDAWVRNTRSRFSSMNTVVSDVSRKDSDITLVDFTGGRLPPKAPRAMLQASQATLIKHPSSAQGEAPYEALIASPTGEAEDHSPIYSTSLVELVHQAIKMCPTLMPMSQSTAEIDKLTAAARQASEDQSGHQSQVVFPIHPATPSSSTDFVSCLPTQPGIWFKQLGRRYAEIVDIDMEVGDDVFYASRERLRMHLRLCSIPVDVMTKNDGGNALMSLEQVDSVTEQHALRWPKKGKLIVQVNPESERSKTWLPHTLESDPLDVTSCMRPGKNTFRFIQLSDLSGFTFVLVASPPPPEEEWRSWDWASFVGRSRSRSSPTDGPTNSLSDFARLPVVVRS